MDNEEKYFSELLKRNNHHRVKLESVAMLKCQKNFVLRYPNYKNLSQRQRLEICNTTFFIKLFDSLIAYRGILYKDRITFIVDGLIEHSTQYGKIYEKLERFVTHDGKNFSKPSIAVVFLSHYFDRFALRNEPMSRLNAMKRCLNDHIVLNFVQYREKAPIKIHPGDGDQDVYAYSDGGLALGTSHPDHDMLIMRTYVSEKMLKEEQIERWKRFEELKKGFPTRFRSISEVEKFSKFIF